MFKALLSQDSTQTWAAVLGFIVLLFMGRKAWVDYKIRRAGGVRSSVLATNPLTGKATCFGFR